MQTANCNCNAIAPSGASLCTLCTYLGYLQELAIVAALPVDFIVNDLAPPGIFAWLRALLYRGAQVFDILLIFSSLDGTNSVRLK